MRLKEISGNLGSLSLTRDVLYRGPTCIIFHSILSYSTQLNSTQLCSALLCSALLCSALLCFGCWTLLLCSRALPPQMSGAPWLLYSASVVKLCAPKCLGLIGCCTLPLCPQCLGLLGCCTLPFCNRALCHQMSGAHWLLYSASL